MILGFGVLQWRHDLSPLSQTQHLGWQSLATLLLWAMSSDRSRRLGSGTLSHARIHHHDGGLAPRLVGGKRRDRGTARQL